jgi:hypothetical protein
MPPAGEWRVLWDRMVMVRDAAQEFLDLANQWGSAVLASQVEAAKRKEG